VVLYYNAGVSNSNEEIWIRYTDILLPAFGISNPVLKLKNNPFITQYIPLLDAME